MSETITSAANPVVKRARSLAERKHRRREGAFLVEGGQPVWRAVESGWDVETLLVCDDLLHHERALAMVAEQEAAGVRVARLSEAVFGRLSERAGPGGIAAVVRTRTTSLAEVEVGPDTLVVALHRIGNPGNLGTIIRAADAAGASAVVLLGETTDPFAPVAVKAAMGSLFAVPVVSEPDAGAFLDWARERGVTVSAASGYAAEDHWALDWAGPTAVLLGSEGDGLPDELLDRAHRRVRIPMTGTAESLNVAVAASLLAYEARRHRI